MNNFLLEEKNVSLLRYLNLLFDECRYVKFTTSSWTLMTAFWKLHFRENPKQHQN